MDSDSINRVSGWEVCGEFGSRIRFFLLHDIGGLVGGMECIGASRDVCGELFLRVSRES